MIKMIISGRRKPGLSLSEFDAYWDNEHGRLAQEVSAALRIKRYVQSIRVETPALKAFASDRGENEGVTPDFVAELWFDSVDDMAAAFDSPRGQAASARLARDEEVFCDRSSFVILVTEERVKVEN
jgi:uncharacterized protein (TIGR02118 family)